MSPDDQRPVRRLLGHGGVAPPPGLIILKEGQPMADHAKKAPADGVYLLDGRRFRARKGALLPAGASMADVAEPTEAAAKRKTTRSKAPAESTEAAGPSETS